MGTTFNRLYLNVASYVCVWVTVGGVYSWLTLLTFPLSIRFILISAEYQFTWRSQNHDLEAVSFRVTCYLSLQWSSVFNFMWPQVRNTANQFVGQDLMVWLLECFLKYKTIEKKKFVVIWRHLIDLDFERISILRKKPTKLQKSNPIQSAISHTSFNLPSRYTFPMFNEGILKTNINNWIDDLFKIHIIYGVFPIIDSNIDHKLTGKERNSYKRPIKRNAYCKHSQKKTANTKWAIFTLFRGVFFMFLPPFDHGHSCDPNSEKVLGRVEKSMQTNLFKMHSKVISDHIWRLVSQTICAHCDPSIFDFIVILLTVSPIIVPLFAVSSRHICTTPNNLSIQSVFCLWIRKCVFLFVECVFVGGFCFWLSSFI